MQPAAAGEDTPEVQAGEANSNGTRASMPVVLVVGAGPGGLAAERALRHLPVAVTVVDARNHSVFQPLLFEAAVGVIVPEDVARPVRSLLRRGPRTTFRVGEVIAIDWEARRARLVDGDELRFDYLILATGVVPSYERVTGAAEYAVPLKSVVDATRLRNSVLRSFEAAAAHPDRVEPGQTSVAIVGGGATGVELAGYLSDVMFRSFVQDYPRIPRERMRVTVVELGDRLLPSFHPRLSRYAEDVLRSRGVDVRLHTRVERVDGDGVIFEGGERIPASTVVWAGGVTAPDCITNSVLPTDHGRVVVEKDLRIAGRPEAFAIGDLAAVRSRSGTLRPQVAQVAIQGGRHAARQIEHLIAGRPTQPFRYFDKGSMAVIGVYAAVLQMGRLRLTGPTAWVAWGLLHLAYLPGMPNRLRALQTWRWWHVTHEASARLLIEDGNHGQRLAADRELG